MKLERFHVTFFQRQTKKGK